MRDISPPSGLSAGDQGDVFGASGAAGRRGRRIAAARELSHQPRHLRANGDRAYQDRGEGPDDDVDDRDGNGEDTGAKPRRHWRRTILEWLGVIGGGIAIALLVEAFLIQAFWIPSPSMEHTLDVGDRVLVNKLSYKLHDVHRGDVVVFERPPGASTGEDGEIKDLIKRVIAVGGDTIEAREGAVYVNGELIDEDYLEPGTPTDNLPLTTIPDGRVFVMGDNRTNSEDSRIFGPIDEDDIVGRAFLRVLPITDIGWL
ncbi:MAG: signal peptidase I [Acidimicrobiales bacterium]